MKDQGSHEQRISALGGYCDSCAPTRKRCLRRLDTSEFMRPGYEPERAVPWSAVIHVDSHRHELLENTVRWLDEDDAFLLAPTRERRVIDAA